MKVCKITLYATSLLAVATLPLCAHSTASSGTGRGKATQTSKPTSSATSPSQKIDINSASSDQLDAPPGIGSAYSQKIIDGRPYNSKRDMRTRKVVPQSTYDGIQDKIIARRATGTKGKSSTDMAPKTQ